MPNEGISPDEAMNQRVELVAQMLLQAAVAIENAQNELGRLLLRKDDADER